MKQLITFKKFFITCTVLLGYGSIFAQTQIGNDIDGSFTSGNFGNAVSMPNDNVVAIGAYKYFGANGASEAGRVSIYEWDGSNWNLKGGWINGVNAGDRAGVSVSMPTEDYIGIGAYFHASQTGHVRVFGWNGAIWTQVGNDIDGDAAGDRAGTSISMPDQNTIGIGAYLNDDGPGNDSGKAKVFEWTTNGWTQKGSDLLGAAAIDEFGFRVDMPDANTIAVGARKSDINGIRSGSVTVFNWDGTNWVQKGSILAGVSSEDRLGEALSMPDSNTIAVGSWRYSGDTGLVNVYEWDGNDWVLKGSSLIGDNSGDAFGFSIDMVSPDRLAIGARTAKVNGVEKGSVKIFNWDGSSWVQEGSLIEGENLNDEMGFSVNFGSTETIACGARSANSNTNTDTGHVRVFSLPTLSTSSHSKTPSVQAYPNPMNTVLRIKMISELNKAEIFNIQGQKIIESKTKTIDVSRLNSGIYLVKIENEYGNISTMRIIKQ